MESPEEKNKIKVEDRIADTLKQNQFILIVKIDFKLQEKTESFNLGRPLVRAALLKDEL